MATLSHSISFKLTPGPYRLIPVMRELGRLQHQDYKVARPLIDYYLNNPEDPDMKLLIDASRIKGWSFRASWDSLKLALKHGRKFSKVAILGQRRRHRLAAQCSQWLLHSEIRTFDNLESALSWLDSEPLLFENYLD